MQIRYTEDRVNGPAVAIEHNARLREELVQVAAVACAMIQQLDKGEA